MTERTDSAIATAEAIIKLLEEPPFPDAKYSDAVCMVRIYAHSLRLHQPPKRGRRPEQHPRGFPPGSPPKN